MKQAVLFDLDGTLWDAGQGVADAWNSVMIRHGKTPDVTEQRVHGYMGWPMDAIGEDLFKEESDPEIRHALLDECTAAENELLSEKGGVLYPQLKETLEELKKTYVLMVVSNCQCGYIEAFVHAHQLEELFDDFISWGDTGKDKDSNIREIMERNSISEAVYAGDIDKDYQSATKAGIPFILAKYGFGDLEAEFEADTIPDLIRLIPQALEKAYQTKNENKS